ncbi:hypothetical protein TCAL_03129 [Tigriopus californicus]|uniref:Innexin n=1 Tax=Tigriopus californicus TaxID=6832 RepID=A0A553P1W9_TIGCA|nr:hypothetical protein TCAL_03129 [Tigriopus californicus]|eukprot:TCALIF_03129-PA protein Name:"Similar to Inx3 Innexin inx3 (Drosophila melanogaster)" AED:0.04 eAED:0.04 QI:21/0.8/0.66/1/1/1/6/39/443
MLFGVILGLSGFFKSREKGQAIIDDFPFRLFYGFTGGVLFLCTALVGVQELVGNNISCHGGKNHQAVDQYCWVSGTHLVANSNDKRGLGKGVMYGDESCQRRDDSWFTSDGKECIKTHSYYQWVPYVLLLQGKLSAVSEGIRMGSTQGATDKEKVRNVANNVVQYINMKNAGHTIYGWAYVLAQFLNVLVLAFSVIFNNSFLDGEFNDLGYRWVKAVFDSSESSSMVLYQTFPRLTRCLFQTFGSAGDLTEDSFLCVLAPNIISEKIFVFLWFWYTILGFICGLNLILILLMVFKSSSIRSYFLMRAVLSTKIKRHITSNENLQKKIENMEFGKFLFIYLLGRNVEFFAYKRILDLIAELHQEDQPYINEEAQNRGSNLQRQLSKSNVKDVSTNELYGPLPQAPPQIPEHEDAYEMSSTLPKYTYQDKDLQESEGETKSSTRD